MIITTAHGALELPLMSNYRKIVEHPLMEYYLEKKLPINLLNNPNEKPNRLLLEALHMAKFQ